MSYELNKSCNISLITSLALFACQPSITSDNASPDSIEVNCHNDHIEHFNELEIKANAASCIDGINIANLIADPTPAEIDIALEEINQRNRSIKSLIEEDTFTVAIGEYKATARIVSHIVDGNRHYGCIITPQTKRTSLIPVLVNLEGFGQQNPSVWINQKNLLLTHLNESYWHRFVIVIPSFRGQNLYFNDSTNHTTSYKSEGERNDAFDGPTEDALSLLNVALETVDNIDKDKILVMGGSRGGTVGLLMAERDARIQWVLNFVGPLDFIGRTLFQRTFDLQLLEEGLKSNSNIPTNLGEQYVYFFLQNLKKGKASLSSVRKKIIQCSPYYFVSRLKTTRIQMHYGAKDISFVQLQRFNMKMDDLGYKYPNYELFIYPNREHDLVGDKPVEIRVSRFIDKILEYN